MPLQGDLSTSDWGVGPQPIAGAHRVVSTDVAAGPRGPLVFTYQATNKCCRDWLLIDWPSDPEGRPMHVEATKDPVLGVDCPQCKGMIYFDIGRPDIYRERDDNSSSMARLAGGRLKVA